MAYKLKPVDEIPANVSNIFRSSYLRDFSIVFKKEVPIVQKHPGYFDVINTEDYNILILIYKMKGIAA